MPTDLSSIIKLQEFDIAITEASEKATSFDSKIKEKTDLIASLKTKLTDSKNEVVNRQKKKKELELDAANKEKLIEKHNGELNSLKSNDAYKAMLGEIEAAKQELSKIEDGILMALDSIDEAEKSLKEKEQSIKAEEGTIKGQVQAIEAEKNQALEQEKKAKEERDAYAKTVPADLLKNYESIRTKKGGVAIVPVSGSACTGCSMNLPTYKLAEIKLAKDVVLCESCQRIVYLPPENKEAAPSK